MRRHQLSEEQQDLIEAYIPGRNGQDGSPSRRFQELAINFPAVSRLAANERYLRLGFSDKPIWGLALEAA